MGETESSSRKRRRPWAMYQRGHPTITRSKLYTIASVIVASSLVVDGLPYFVGGVSAEEPPNEDDVNSPTLSPMIVGIATPEPPDAFTSPPPSMTVATMEPSLSPVKIRKEAVSVLFDLVLGYSGNANLNQLTKDVDGVLETYILSNVQSLEVDGLNARDVLLGVTLSTRKLRKERRLQERQARDVIVRVDGNVLYDIEAGGCVECVDDKIESKLEEALTVEAMDELFRSNAVEGVIGVRDVREAPPLPDDGASGNGRGDNRNTSGDKNALQGSEQQSVGNTLERPSTLSIAFGFALTGIAFLGLLLYGYIFYRKRQKRLRKERQQRQSIEYRMPNSHTSPSSTTMSRPNHQRVSPAAGPPIVPPLGVPADNLSEESSIKGLETLSSDGGPADAFAHELQMAATRDQQAWDDFQRKKKALDRNREIPPSYGQLGSTSPIPPPPKQDKEPAKRDAWTKSFPYGDEPFNMDDQGVEWTAEDFGLASNDDDRGVSLPAYNPRVESLPEEKKDDYASRVVARDPEPMSPPSSALPQSIGRTLSQHGTPQNNGPFIDNETNEVVDEVARLSRFVQRYEKRRERRIQWESERHSKSAPEASAPQHSLNRATPASANTSNSPVTTRGRSLRRSASPPPTKPSENNNAYLNNMRATPPSSLPNGRQRYEAPVREDKRRSTSYTGINMAGGLYHDATLEDINRPVLSLSEDSEEYSYRDEDGSARSQRRLGITPFNVQKAREHPSGYDGDLLSPTMDIISRGVDREQPTRSSNSNIAASRNFFTRDQNTRTERPRTKSEGSSFHSNRSRLSDLRTNSAIIDSSQSDVNVGNFPAPGTPTPEPQKLGAPFSRTSTKAQATSNSATKNSSAKSSFSKLRNIFEGRPKNAIFPPDENWQSGVSKN